MSAHGWGRRKPLLFALAVVACGEATNGEGGSGSGRCITEGEVRLPTDSDAAAIGSVTVRDLDRRPVDAFGAPTPAFQGSQLTARFRTITSTGAEPPILPLGSCVGIIGRPEVSVDQAEAVGPLVFEFPDREEMVNASMPDTNPRYFKNFVDEFILPEEGSVTVSGGGAGSFAPFSISAPTVRPLTVTAPATDGSFVLPPSGFELRWNADPSADFVELTVAPARSSSDGGTGGQLVCVLADTGCFALDAPQVNFLRQAQVEAYNLTVRRIRGERIQLAEEVEVELEVLSEVIFGLQAEPNR